MGDAKDKEPNYEYELRVPIMAVIGMYESNRINYWENRLGQEDWSEVVELQRSADEIANQVMSAAGNLAAPDIESTSRQFAQALYKYQERVKDDEVVSQRRLFKTLWLKEEGSAELREQYDLVLSQGTQALNNWLDTHITDEMIKDFIERLMKEMGISKSKAQWRAAEFWSLDDLETGQELLEGSPLRLIWERICIDLAREFIDRRLFEAAKRLLLLMNIAVSTEPTKDTAGFLRHISRCYIWGFDTECVILCRSALDTAFRDRISEDECLRRFRQSPPHGFGLLHRIEAACPAVITKDQKDAAIRVKTRGDKTVHDQPDITTDILPTIRDALAVISALSS